MTAKSELSELTVRCHGVSKSYGGRKVVDNVDLEVAQGEIVGILGPNGSGKTTFVECIQGLRKPDEGTIRLFGEDPITSSNARRRIGSQLQESALPARLRVGEAIRLFAEDSAIDVDEVLERWRIGHLTKSAFGELSGGERQKLFIALALVNDPDLVFLDEVTQGLDPLARRGVWEAIKSIRQDGKAVVVVTHFMDEAEALCDRIILMRDGVKVLEGSVVEILQHYETEAIVRVRPHIELEPGIIAKTVADLSVVRSCEIADNGSVDIVCESDEVLEVCAALATMLHQPTIEVHRVSLEQILIDHVGGAKWAG